ncbi:TIR domain-containing protein [Duganella sp. FT134W]|uniref:TIR domain-containing protein n=1 Tax=Duganella margarita TaxID=2692170 RepID=A0A7X4H5Y9_9BURK|nr:TIR domain-containing protein [Duganella margarita]MYM75990.1 TIR domain-containing protein [Duganella margarita]
MAKIFLSHSSRDKDIVSKVYAELGHANAHYDVATFDPTGFLPDEIYEALSDSDTFVLFASKVALESPWVQGELRIAFLNWMRAGIKDVMVFLLRDGTRSMVPEWLQSYVILEHPSPAHIVSRVKSRLISNERNYAANPPFYQYENIVALEQRVAIGGDKMPKAIMLCGSDGYGKKQLANELYARHFSSVPKYKIYLPLDKCSSEVDLYKATLGTFSLLTISDLSARLREFEYSEPEVRFSLLAEEIGKVCLGQQALIIESKDSLLGESGELIPWLQGLIEALPKSTYPRLILLSIRRPTYISANIVEDLAVHQLRPLTTDNSILLFKWWLKKLGVQQPDYVVEQLLDRIDGSQKQIELAARLVSNLDIPKGLLKNKNKIFSDLEAQAYKLLLDIEQDRSCSLILEFIAECGYVSETDLIAALDGALELPREEIADALLRLVAYGFVITDEISLRLPAFLSRSARSFNKDPEVASAVKSAWNRLVRMFGNIDEETESSLPILTEVCLSKLQSGENSLSLVDSIILPSQCFRLARKCYDDNAYLKSLELCKKAYERRIALTDEGAIEVLRIMGLSAARLGNSAEFSSAIDCFEQYGGHKKARRIKEYLLGFEARLAGRFDQAMTRMHSAYQLAGNGDIHILRELAFLYWAQDDFVRARDYIRPAKAKAPNNPFIIEMEIKIELAQGEGYIRQNIDQIGDLIEKITAVERDTFTTFSLPSRIEFQLATKNIQIARQMISEKERNGGLLPAIQLLKAKALMADKQYGEAKDILIKLKSQTENDMGNQRLSARPKISRLIIEAASGISVSDGINEYERNAQYLPNVIAKKMRSELKELAAFSGQTLTSKERQFLNS